MGSIARTIGYADTTAPTAPTLSLTAQGTDALLAAWTPATDTGTGVRYYRLYVGTTAGTLALTETFSRATTAWLISGLPAQSTRYARVDAVDGAGNVSSSAVVSGTTQAQGTGGALAFAQPSPVTYAAGQTVSLALSQYVTGGGATKLYHRMSGSLPGDLSLATATGAITGTARKVGSYGPVIRVTDTTAEALEADWIARSSAPGVQWAHDFRAQSEVDKFTLSDGSGNFQYDGSGNLCVRRITSDGITGGACLEYFCPAGSHVGMRWSRCFNPVPGDIGYVSGANVNWRSGTDWVNYRRGLYGHPSYWVSQAGSGREWIGHDFYIQFRVKNINCFDPAHGFASNGGKIAYIDLAGGSNQEIIMQAPASYAGRVLRLYTNSVGGNRSNTGLDAFQGQNGRGNAVNEQPGGDFWCTYPSFTGCWQWPDDTSQQEWVTVLIHVVPGRHNGDDTQPNMAATSNKRETGIEVWVAREGATSYSKVYEKFDYVWSFDSSGLDAHGFNVFTPSTYMNGLTANPAASWARRFDQVIFSKNKIACPQVYA